MLAASPSASYVYEPLFGLDHTNVQAWDDKTNGELAQQAEWYIKELFTCGRVRACSPYVIPPGREM